jgi:hypothetical protein
MPSNSDPSGFRSYGGSSYHVLQRIVSQHVPSLISGRHYNRTLQSSVKKHGLDSARFRVAEVCSKENLSLVEQRYLDAEIWSMNVAKKAILANVGIKTKAEVRAKISAKLKGRKLSEETRAKLSAAAKRPGHYLRGKKMDPAHALKCRESLTGILISMEPLIFDAFRSGRKVHDICADYNAGHNAIRRVIKREATRRGVAWPVSIVCKHCGKEGGAQSMRKGHAFFYERFAHQPSLNPEVHRSRPDHGRLSAAGRGRRSRKV